MPATSIYRSIDVYESAEVVKDSPGRLYAIHAINTATGVRYLKFYDASSPTVGITTPVMTFAVPAQSSGFGGGFTFKLEGYRFSTALHVAATTGVADNDTGAPGAYEVLVNLEYV